MAELVFQNLEGMLPELEDLEKNGVFTKDELKIIVKRRTDFEYKLQKRVVCKEDILNYLEYEMKLDTLRKRRSKKLKLKVHNTTSYSLSKRIHKLFRNALMKFGDDLKLWLQYIEFCKRTSANRAISVAFGNLLQKHCNNTDAWIFAAKYEFEDANNVDNARSLLQRALRQNKQCKKLWLEYFRLELLHVSKLKRRRKALGVGGIGLRDEKNTEPQNIDDFLSNKTAEIVYKNAIKVFQGDLEFRLQFLEMTSLFDETENNVEEVIFNSLTEDFEDNEDVCEILCRRPITNVKRKQNEEIVKDTEWQSVEKKVIDGFEKMMTKLNTPKMWEKYLNCFGELLQESKSPEQTQRRIEQVSAIITQAEKEEKMTESMCIFWLELLSDIEYPDAVLKYTADVLKQFPNNIDLWQKYLVTKTETMDSWNELKAEFKKALSSVASEDDIVLWQMYVDVAKRLEFKDTKVVFEEVMNSSRKTVKEFFLPQYIAWLYEQKGIKTCRSFYRKLLTTRLPLEFLEKCLGLEEAQEKVSVVCMRSLYENIIDYHGKDNADVWLSYIKFQRKYDPTDMERCSMMYNKARMTLEGPLNAEFITKYTLMQTSSI